MKRELSFNESCSPIETPKMDIWQWEWYTLPLPLLMFLFGFGMKINEFRMYERRNNERYVENKVVKKVYKIYKYERELTL